MARKLKVFRTAVGFHDAYVAAPSRTAALKAWGTEKNLFASEAAEEVSDPDLSAEALSKPGTVILKPRLSLVPPSKSATPLSAPSPDKRGRPKPSSRALDDANAALKAFEQDARTRQALLAQRRAALEDEIKRAEADLQSQGERLKAKRDRLAEAYLLKMAEWEDQAG
jgi:hypothetical protein